MPKSHLSQPHAPLHLTKHCSVFKLLWVTQMLNGLGKMKILLSALG